MDPTRIKTSSLGVVQCPGEYDRPSKLFHKAKDAYHYSIETAYSLYCAECDKCSELLHNRLGTGADRVVAYEKFTNGFNLAAATYEKSIVDAKVMAKRSLGGILGEHLIECFIFSYFEG